MIQPDVTPGADDPGLSAGTATAARYRVEGMDCGACARTLERVVGALDGVESAEVSFGAATLSLRGDVPEDRVLAAVSSAGFTRSSVRRPPAGAGVLLAARPARRLHRRLDGRARRGGRARPGRGRPDRGRAGLPGVDGDRRLADRPGRSRRAAPPLARHERADGARRAGSRRDRLVRGGCLGAGAVRARHDARDVRARPHPPVGRVAGRAGTGRGPRPRSGRGADGAGRRRAGRCADRRAARRAAAAGRGRGGRRLGRRPVGRDGREHAGRQGSRRRGLRGHAEPVRRARGAHHPGCRLLHDRPHRRAGGAGPGHPVAVRAHGRPVRPRLHAAGARRRGAGRRGARVASEPTRRRGCTGRWRC